MTVGNHAHNNNDFYPCASCGFYEDESSQKGWRRAAEKMKFSKSVDEFEAADEEHEQDMKDVAQMERIVKLCPTQGPINC